MSFANLEETVGSYHHLGSVRINILKSAHQCIMELRQEEQILQETKDRISHSNEILKTRLSELQSPRIPTSPIVTYVDQGHRQVADVAPNFDSYEIFKTSLRELQTPLIPTSPIVTLVDQGHHQVADVALNIDSNEILKTGLQELRAPSIPIVSIVDGGYRQVAHLALNSTGCDELKCNLISHVRSGQDDILLDEGQHHLAHVASNLNSDEQAEDLKVGRDQVAYVAPNTDSNEQDKDSKGQESNTDEVEVEDDKNGEIVEFTDNSDEEVSCGERVDKTGVPGPNGEDIPKTNSRGFADTSPIPCLLFPLVFTSCYELKDHLISHVRSSGQDDIVRDEGQHHIARVASNLNSDEQVEDSKAGRHREAHVALNLNSDEQVENSKLGRPHRFFKTGTLQSSEMPIAGALSGATTTQGDLSGVRVIDNSVDHTEKVIKVEREICNGLRASGGEETKDLDTLTSERRSSEQKNNLHEKAMQEARSWSKGSLNGMAGLAFSCEICDFHCSSILRSFESCSSVYVRAGSSEDKRSDAFCCRICQEDFRSAVGLLGHMQEVHAPVCDKCKTSRQMNLEKTTERLKMEAEWQWHFLQLMLNIPRHIHTTTLCKDCTAFRSEGIFTRSQINFLHCVQHVRSAGQKPILHKADMTVCNTCKEYSCLICTKSYSVQDRMWLHMRSAHPQEYQRWQSFEEKTERRNGEIERNNSSPEGKRDQAAHKCMYCAHEFEIREKLMEHTRYEHNLFLCSICPKRFRLHVMLVTHMRREHLGEIWDLCQTALANGTSNPVVKVAECAYQAALANGIPNPVDKVAECAYQDGTSNPVDKVAECAYQAALVNGTSNPVVKLVDCAYLLPDATRLTNASVTLGEPVIDCEAANPEDGSASEIQRKDVQRRRKRNKTSADAATVADAVVVSDRCDPPPDKCRPKGAFVCYLCMYSTPNCQILESHVNRFHRGVYNAYKCKGCQRFFNNSEDFFQHSK